MFPGPASTPARAPACITLSRLSTLTAGLTSTPGRLSGQQTKQKQTKQNKDKQNNCLHFLVLFNNAKETKIYLSNFCFEYFPQNQTP